MQTRSVHTLILGSGAAGLCTAVRLKEAGVDDLVIVSEGLDKGTSINTGSDKQTYYKLSLCGNDNDSPLAMAETFFAGGAMHGDLALVEAALSPRGFLHLANLGVPFPCDPFGQFVGYKTDHDPRRRATSVGPYTSREMCRALIRRVREMDIPVLENRLAVELLTAEVDGAKRTLGAIFVDEQGQFEAVQAENVVFAVGGPGGIYKTSVYPEVHSGGIGLALLAGATAQGLPESQYGMASTKFRWNVSGTFMQVVPRFISTGADGDGEPKEFLRDYIDDPGRLHSLIFLKGYQWPFDSRKALGGSSLIDILVYVETVLRGRRVSLDFRSNPADFAFESLDDEAREYLANSGAAQQTPIERLRHMNPGAIQLYADHEIDITIEPLEIAVCAQHNNGGLAANHWWESVNVKHLFPVGEVNGSHGAYRPGGSALNSGQVGAFRAAEYIAARYREKTAPEDLFGAEAEAAIERLGSSISEPGSAARSWREELDELQNRMTAAAAHIREPARLRSAVAEAGEQWLRLLTNGCSAAGPAEIAGALKTRYLCYTHLVYLEAVRFWLESGVGSRGSAVVLDPEGQKIHDRLDDSWRMLAEDEAFREVVQETLIRDDGRIEHRWAKRRPIPESDTWFETAWAKFRDGEIYDGEPGEA